MVCKRREIHGFCDPSLALFYCAPPGDIMNAHYQKPDGVIHGDMLDFCFLLKHRLFGEVKIGCYYPPVLNRITGPSLSSCYTWYTEYDEYPWLISLH